MRGRANIKLFFYTNGDPNRGPQEYVSLVWERNFDDEYCSHSDNTQTEHQYTEICCRCFSGTIGISSTVTSAQFSVSRIPSTVPLFIMHHHTFVTKSNSHCYVQHFKAYVTFQRRLNYCLYSFGYFPGAWLWFADVSEHSICSIFKGWMWSMKYG